MDDSIFSSRNSTVKDHEQPEHGQQEWRFFLLGIVHVLLPCRNSFFCRKLCGVILDNGCSFGEDIQSLLDICFWRLCTHSDDSAMIRNLMH